MTRYKHRLTKKTCYLPWLALVYFLFISSGCKKLVEIDSPNYALVSATVFQDSVSSLAAMNGCYTLMYHGSSVARTSFSFRTSTLPAMSADELTYLSGNVYDPFVNNAITANDTYIQGLWFNSYESITRINKIIEGLEKSTKVSASFRNLLTGEAKTLRAFCYFNLVNYFGAVPLITTSDIDQINATARTPVAQIYEQIKADLLVGKNNAAADFARIGGERTRASRWAASALLARVYLYLGDFSGAEREATDVISNNALFGMVPELDNVFIKNSRESIWQFNTTGSGTNAAYIAAEFVPASASGAVLNYALRNGLISAYPIGDKRKISWMRTYVFNNTTYYYPYKYKIRTLAASANNQEYDMVLRLAEQYLIRAEARAKLNNIQGSQDDVNQIRSRAGLNNTTATDQPSLLLAIEQERRLELFTEWGHRWFDLKRSGKADAILGTLKGAFWQSTDQLYPISQDAINKTAAVLDQNPGY